MNWWCCYWKTKVNACMCITAVNLFTAVILSNRIYYIGNRYLLEWKYHARNSMQKLKIISILNNWYDTTAINFRHLKRLPAACHYSSLNRGNYLNTHTTPLIIRTKCPDRQSSHGVIPPLPALTLGNRMNLRYCVLHLRRS